MSEPNVETVRRLNEAPDKPEAGLSYYHPDLEFHSPPEWPEARVYRGHGGLAALAEAWFGSFDEYRWDAEDFIDAGDCVVALIHHRGRIGGPCIEQRSEASFICVTARSRGSSPTSAGTRRSKPSA